MGRRTKIPLEIIFYTLSFLIVMSMYKGCYTIEGMGGTEKKLEVEIKEKEEEIEDLEKQNLQAQGEEGCADDLCKIAQKYKEKSDISLAKKRDELKNLQESLNEFKHINKVADDNNLRADDAEKKAIVATEMADGSDSILAEVRPTFLKMQKIAQS